jgi:ABC transporter substrate binding protein
MAAKAAGPTTPVVFVIGEDPVKAGLVASLNRPGGNATGVSDFVNQLVAKRLDILLQAMPGIGLVGLLVNPNNPMRDPTLKRLKQPRTHLVRSCWSSKRRAITSWRQLSTPSRTSGRCYRRQYRPVPFPSPGSDHLASCPPRLARDLSGTPVCGCRRPDELQSQSFNLVASSGFVCCANLAG